MSVGTWDLSVSWLIGFFECGTLVALLFRTAVRRTKTWLLKPTQ